MPLPYNGPKGELNFEQDFVELLISKGWDKEILYHKTVAELVDNWRDVIFQRNRTELNNVPLSESEMDRLLDTVRSQANTPVKANGFILGETVPVLRDSDSPDTKNVGKDVFLNIFSPDEIAGGSSIYQIAEQVVFDEQEDTRDRRGDITLLIDGIPVIHIELKASGVPIDEATTQIKKYIQERKFTGFMGLVQVFWAITPEDALYFANPGDASNMNPAFFFHWGSRDNEIIRNWKELIDGKSNILSIPEAHQMIGYYAVADTNKDVLKICRSYQYTAIRAIVKRAKDQKWGDRDQLGGFVWCTTGGGKTLTSYKAGQIIIDRGYADKVVFLVDRKALDSQSNREYNSFAPDGKKVHNTSKTTRLFNLLLSDKSDEEMIITSMQKVYRINDEKSADRKDELEKIKKKRIVFIVDEAHRSQFGEMHRIVKETFYHALFFGFTGTPIFPENMRDGEQITETVFGRCLAVYSLATGIRDGNVLGFYPKGRSTYDDDELRKNVALRQCGAVSIEEAKKDQDKWEIYRYFTMKAPMASQKDEYGNLKRDSSGRLQKGIEEYLPLDQYNNDDHRMKVVQDIIDNFDTVAHGEYGTLFHGILATTSIPEAYEYWKLFKKLAPELRVTALFDASTDTNTGKEFDVEVALTSIVKDYSDTYDLKLSWKDDPKCEKYKEDLIARLAHSKPYTNIGDNQCLDIVIVVHQLLTGFDSQFVNVLYLDQVLETDALIQAISRTNRVYDNNEKPMGLLKFYRKIHTMKVNLNDALRLYCQGDYADVQVMDLEENTAKMNTSYQIIKELFEADHISGFVQLPKSDESRQKFRKGFFTLKSLMRTVMLQGLKWDNEYGKRLDFDKQTYSILSMRYEDLPSNRGNGGKKVKKPGWNMFTNLTPHEMDKIDAEYLEKQFRIVTLKDVTKKEEQLFRQAAAIEDIKKNIGILPIRKQKYALQVLDDIKKGVLLVEEGKKFMEYIEEYAGKTIRKAIESFTENFGISSDDFFAIYTSTGDFMIALSNLEQTADMDKVKKFFNITSGMKAKAMLHDTLYNYIKEQKADAVE